MKTLRRGTHIVRWRISKVEGIHGARAAAALSGHLRPGLVYDFIRAMEPVEVDVDEPTTYAA